MSKLIIEELDQLNGYYEKYSEILSSIGSLEIQKNQLLNSHKELVSLFNEFTIKLKDKYGSVNIDLKTGEFKQEEQ